MIAATFFGIGVVLGPWGCRSEPAFVLDSDIPAPQEASGRATTGIERRGDLLVGIDTVFAERVLDPMATLRDLGTRFEAGGWTAETMGATGSIATGVFRKSDRRCRVRVIRNDLDPGMSCIAYRLDTVEASTPASDG